MRQVITYTEGEAVVWDHSFRHEAFHEGPTTRVILIVDFWHPDLTDEEASRSAGREASAQPSRSGGWTRVRPFRVSCGCVAEGSILRDVPEPRTPFRNTLEQNRDQ